MEGCDSETLPGNSSALTVREGGINLKSLILILILCANLA